MDAEPALQRAMRRRIESLTGDGQGVQAAAAAALVLEKAEFEPALAAAGPEWCGAESGLGSAPEREADPEAAAGCAPVPVPVPVYVIVSSALFVWV